MPGSAGQPHGARLRDPRRTARTVDGESDRTPGGEVTAQLDERTCAAARRRSSRHAVTESRDDARDPLAVEVLADDDDDAAVAEVVEAPRIRPCQNAMIGCRPGRDDLVEVVVAFGAPASTSGTSAPISGDATAAIALALRS